MRYLDEVRILFSNIDHGRLDALPPSVEIRPFRFRRSSLSLSLSLSLSSRSETNDAPFRWLPFSFPSISQPPARAAARGNAEEGIFNSPANREPRAPRTDPSSDRKSVASP